MTHWLSVIMELQHQTLLLAVDSFLACNVCTNFANRSAVFCSTDFVVSRRRLFWSGVATSKVFALLSLNCSWATSMRTSPSPQRWYCSSAEIEACGLLFNVGNKATNKYVNTYREKSQITATYFSTSNDRTTRRSSTEILLAFASCFSKDKTTSSST